MKKIQVPFLILISYFLFPATLCFSQPQGQWTWMNGTNTLNAAGVFGTQGVFAPANTPPGLYESVQWTDHNGHFWIFGGLGWSDVWQFDPTINQWAWMKGPGLQNQVGTYGTITVASPLNNPGGRAFASITWTDTANNLWLFGGFGSDVNNATGYLSDLWMYNIATNEWTWMSGPNTNGGVGVYGTLGVAAPANIPGGRCESNASWTDSQNNLWLFGGDVNGGSGSDLWKYSIANNEWTWMSGPNTMNNPAVYGTKGVEAPGNIPSGRFCYAAWKAMNDDLWLFGGYEYNNGAAKNDMWRYNMSTGNWTWMSGTNLNNDTGHAGTQCIPDTANVPSSRAENRSCWTRGCDNFENFGGSPSLGSNINNNLWNYNVSTNQWTWMSGTMNPNDVGNYGTILVSSPANMPPARMGSDGFKDLNGNLWLFGGYDGGSYYNDMWRFVPDTTCPAISGNGGPIISAFNATPLSGCVPLTVTFHNTSQNGTNYKWYFGDGDSSTVTNPTHTFIDTGVYTVTLITINNSACGPGSDTLVLTNYITVSDTPHIAFVADTLVGCSPFTVNFTNSSTGAVSYKWNFGDGDTSLVTNPSHTYLNPGTYTVTLIAYGSGACNDTLVRNAYIVVQHDTVASAFAGSPLTGCDSVTVHFTNSSFNGTSYIWHFGDGNSDTAANPTHTYTTSGTYTVTLITTNTSLCGTISDTTIITNYVTVNPSAHVAFTPDSTFGCVPLIVNFINNSTNVINYLWTFGDTGTSTISNPSHTYVDSGTFIVTLIGIGAGGCNDTLRDTIRVIKPPIVTTNFTGDTLSGCNPFTVNFTNSSTNGTNYVWNFGDSTALSTSNNPSHTYTKSGTFTVTLIAFTNTPCGRVADTTVKISYIIVADPVAIKSSFTENQITGCAPLIVNFTNSSTNANSYIWTFGDGWFDTTKNPTHIYIDTGSYTVTLIIFSNDSLCRTKPDTAVFDYIIVDSCNLYIPNVFSPNGDGKNELFYLNAEGYTNYHLVIFNRWGEKLFESTDSKILWNGKINNTGADVPDGTYYYIFSANDPAGKIYSTHGYLTLIR
jgi:gliding motility-associated-like protein